jgi:hypothetical protein
MNAITARKTTEEAIKKIKEVETMQFQSVMNVVYALIDQNAKDGKFEAIIPLKDMGQYSCEVITKLKSQYYSVISGNDGILVEW